MSSKRPAGRHPDATEDTDDTVDTDDTDDIDDTDRLPPWETETRRIETQR